MPAVAGKDTGVAPADVVSAVAPVAASVSPMHNDGTTLLEEPFQQQTRRAETSYEANRLRLNILKSFVGSAVLFLPSAFSNAGLVGALLGLSAIAALSILCMDLLIDCAVCMSKELASTAQIINSEVWVIATNYNAVVTADDPSPKNASPNDSETQPPLTNPQFDYGDVGRRAFGSKGRKFVEVSLVASQLGFCCVYLNFVAVNLHDIMWTLSNCGITLPAWGLILAQMPLCIALSWIRDLKFFSLSNAVASFLICAGLLYIIGFCLAQLAANGLAGLVEENPPVGHGNLELEGVFLFKPLTFPLFAGSCVYAFEGIGLVLPLWTTTSEELRPSYKAILNETIGGLLIFYLFIGTIGYLSFGDNVSAAVSSDLPRDGVFTILVQVGYCIALLLTYPLMLYPVIQVAEKRIISTLTRTKTSWPWEKMWQRNLIRTAIVMFTGLLSFLLGGSLDNLVALVGALCSLPLAFIYPSLFHNKIVGGHSTRDNAVAGFGVAAMLVSTAFAIATWERSEVKDCSRP
jgi:proton-coupled amino acid transporter